jgi:hypothetical protein
MTNAPDEPDPSIKPGEPPEAIVRDLPAAERAEVGFSLPRLRQILWRRFVVSSDRVPCCPAGGTQAGISPPAFHSGLGPPVQACPFCGAPYLSSRREWEDFSPVRKVRYLLFTLVYVVLASVYEMGFTFIAVEGFGGRARAVPLWPAVAFGAAWVAGVQAYRVRCSRRRSRSGPHLPFRKRLWELQTGLALKIFCVLMLAAPVLAWILRAALGPDFYP